MAPAFLFVSSYAVVLLLGLQQMNVERRSVLAAALTSPLIGLATWAQIKLIPGPTTVADLCAYLLGGASGIVSSIRLHPMLQGLPARVRRWHANRTRSTVPPLGESAAAEFAEAPKEPHPPEIEAAAEEACIDVLKRLCPVYQMGNNTWLDTRTGGTGTTDVHAHHDRIRRAKRYLESRGRLRQHPMQPHLVRVTRVGDAVARGIRHG